MAKRIAQPFENVRYFSKRLLAALEAMRGNPLTVVEAPAGYGKTVAVREFVARGRVRAVMTGASESSPESFWPDFCHELAREIPEAGEAAAALARLGSPRDFAQTRAALELFKKIPFPPHTVLVFDDCHFLPRSFIDFCENLAVENIANLSLVCVTRHAWAANRGAPRPHSSSSRLDRNVFALTPPEIRELYALCGIPLGAEAARNLHKNTEGWISALYLSLLLYKEEGAAASTADIVTRMKETVRKTVYAPLSAEAKALLFALAPLERFTVSRAGRLYGSNPAALLEELTNKNAFVAFDPKSGAYSLHAIFRQFLMELFLDDAFVPQARRREIYRACGDALMDAHDIAPAMEAWYRAGDFEHALTVIEQDMSRNLVVERASFYIAMFRDCPEEILAKHLGAAFKYALALFIAGDFPAFGAQMGWLAQRCAALPPGEGDRWRGELHVLMALAAFNDIKAMSAHHQKALKLLGGPTRLYGTDSYWTLGCPSVLFMFYRESGALAETLRQMRECLPHYYQLAQHHGAGGEYLMEAEALYGAGEFAGAESVCRAGLGMADRHSQLGNVFCALFLQMRLALLRGDAGALFGRGEKPGLMEEMRGLITTNLDYFLLHTADLCEGWLYAALGLPDNIPRWLRVKPGDDSPLYAFAQGYYFIVHGRALLLNGEHDGVIALFGNMLRAGAFSKNLLFSVYAHIYLTAAYHKTKQSQAALAALKTTLDAALPDALYMPFAENYDLIGPLLTKVLPGKGFTAARIAELGQQIAGSRQAIVTAVLGRFTLTSREREIADLAVAEDGYSVEEIATRLHISPNTVKARLKAVYQKTGSSSRLALKKNLEA
ncbi:MAG: LuxR C-terminal-related transcriptional regulator [Candidatus Adiutrix sp.]|jgi:LuxR family maltose regulon positive regulatory protein|nr:LuxR C-terminal-related transcriptional regulator [Candidatus Adiutrix sp.]